MVKGAKMELDRALQKEILIALSEIYPDAMLVPSLPRFVDDRQFMGNLFYLKEHDLVDGTELREPGRCRSLIDIQITPKGLDFLAGDGGLQAIINA